MYVNNTICSTGKNKRYSFILTCNVIPAFRLWKLLFTSAVPNVKVTSNYFFLKNVYVC